MAPDEERDGYAALLAIPRFRRVALAQTVSRFGDSVHYVALVVLIFDLTGSGLSVSGAVVFEALPAIFLGAFAGAVVDRYRRTSVMIASDLARGALALVMLWAPSLPVIYAVAFGLSLGNLLYAPAAQSLVPSVVPDRLLGRANAVVWSSFQGLHVLGSVLGGAIVGVAGARAAFAVNAVTFLASAALLIGVREPAVVPPTGSEPGRFVDDVRHGFGFATRDPLLRRLLAVQLLAVLSVGGTGALLVVLAREQFGVSGSRFGALVAALGVGAFTGPLLIGRLIDRRPSTAFVFVPYIIRGLIDALLAFLRGFFAPAALLFVYGVNTSTGGIGYTTMIQRRVPEGLRGRIFSALNVQWQIGRLISITGAGALADLVSVQAVYLGGGALLIAAGVLGLRLPTDDEQSHQRPTTR